MDFLEVVAPASVPFLYRVEEKDEEKEEEEDDEDL